MGSWSRGHCPVCWPPESASSLCWFMTWKQGGSQTPKIRGGKEQWMHKNNGIDYLYSCFLLSLPAYALLVYRNVYCIHVHAHINLHMSHTNVFNIYIYTYKYIKIKYTYIFTYIYIHKYICVYMFLLIYWFSYLYMCVCVLCLPVLVAKSFSQTAPTAPVPTAPGRRAWAQAQASWLGDQWEGHQLRSRCQRRMANLVAEFFLWRLQWLTTCTRYAPHGFPL